MYPPKPKFFGLSGVHLQENLWLASRRLLLSLAVEKANDQEAGGEEGCQAGLHPIAMEQGQQTIQTPGEHEQEPDGGTPHGGEIIIRHCFNAADTLRNIGSTGKVYAWRPQLRKVS